MILGQFCIFKTDKSVWQIEQLRPLYLKMVSGPNSDFKELTEPELSEQYQLIEPQSKQHKSIVRILDRIPVDDFEKVVLLFNEETESFEFEPVENKGTTTHKESSEWSDLEKSKKRFIELMKAMTYEPDSSGTSVRKSKIIPFENLKEFEETAQKQSSAMEYRILEPQSRYSLEKLILAPETKLQMDKVILKLELGDFINDEWGLSEISENTSSQCLNFQGPPGTGKTLAARSIGSQLNRKVLQVDYSQLFSKWVGETGKNIQKYFARAQQDNLILFFDEADALVSPRHQDTSSQNNNTNQNIFMQELDKFKGIVILTTNHFQHYDEAMIRRLCNVEFKLPTPEQREQLFKMHTPSKINLSDSFNWENLVKASSDFSGGDIKNVMEQVLGTKATVLRKQNPTMDVATFKDVLRQVVFNEVDFLNEINLIANNKMAYKLGNGSKNKVKMGLVK